MFSALKYRIMWHWSDLTNALASSQIGRLVRVCFYALAFRFLTWRVKRMGPSSAKDALIRRAARVYGKLGTAAMARRMYTSPWPGAQARPAPQLVVKVDHVDEDAPTNPRIPYQGREMDAPGAKPVQVTDLRKWRSTSAKRRAKQQGSAFIAAVVVFDTLLIACFLAALARESF
jgi:hypothetical protein